MYPRGRAQGPEIGRFFGNTRGVASLICQKMRSLVATSILLGLGLSGLGCAHGRADEADTPAADMDAQMARLRHENADLEDQVRNLEERLRYFERSGDAEVAGPVGGSAGRGLPVVKLEPGADEIPEPTHMREAVTLSPLPHSSPYAALEAEEEEDAQSVSPYAQWDAEPEPQAAPAPVAVTSTSGDGVRSYRLVGSRLVDLTKKRRPPAPPKRSSGRSRRASKKERSGIVAQYEAAMAVYKDGRYADAEGAFDSFVRTYPSHDYADNALYWKGEAAYDQEHYADALAAFTEVVERYGGGNKAPDALLKIGLCYGKIGDAANAKDVLTQLIAAYPEARATQIAHSKLAEL